MMGFENENTQKVYPTLDEVLKKKEWGEDDVTVLVWNINELDAKTLVKLGVASPVVAE